MPNGSQSTFYFEPLSSSVKWIGSFVGLGFFLSFFERLNDLYNQTAGKQKNWDSHSDFLTSHPVLFQLHKAISLIMIGKYLFKHSLIFINLKNKQQ